MKARLIGIGIVLGASAALVTSNAISQSTRNRDDPNVQMPSQEEMAEMMEEWAKMMEPGPHHDALNPLVGDWDLTIKTWWGGPGTEPMTSTGTATTEWILNDRFVREEMNASFMMPDETGAMQERPYQGLGLTGYDNHRNVYMGAWLDDMNTTMHTMSGSMTPGSNRLVMYGEMDEPMLNVVGRMVKYVTRMESEDRHVFEMYDLHAGEGYKVMEITYDRK